MPPQPRDEGTRRVEHLPPDRPYLIMVPTEEGGVVRILGLIEVPFQRRPGPLPGDGDRWESVLVAAGTGPEGRPVTLSWPADQLDRMRLLRWSTGPPSSSPCLGWWGWNTSLTTMASARRAGAFRVLPAPGTGTLFSFGGPVDYR